MQSIINEWYVVDPLKCVSYLVFPYRLSIIIDRARCNKTLSSIIITITFGTKRIQNAIYVFYRFSNYHI